MSATQVRACEILLSKCIPSLANIEHSGEVTQNYVARTPEISHSTEQWTADHAPRLNS